LATQELRLLRNSEGSTWRECRLKWYLTFILGFNSTGVNPNFWLGNLVHYVLSEWYLGRTTDPAHLFWELAEASLQELQEAKVDLAGELIMLENIEVLTKWARVGTAMIEGYQEWDAEHRDFDVLDSELSYYLDLEDDDGRPFTLAGRIDLLTENSDGIRVVDFKTAADFRAEKTVDQDPQFRRYPWMVRAAHPEWAGEIAGSAWFALRKIEPSGRSKPPYFKRVLIDINSEGEWEQVGVELHAEATALLSTEERLAERPDLLRNLIYPSPTVDCSWKCDYFQNGLCKVYRSGRDPSKFGQNYGSWGNDHYEEYKLDIKGAVTT
jgi:hypothetical protein